jgi:hypothetical protein
MATKPRKLRREDMLDRLEDMFDEAGNFVVDAGEYGPDAAEPARPAKKQGGRPSLNWPEIDPVIRCYNATRHLSTAPKQEDFIDTIQEWCRHEGWKLPKTSTLEDRIQKLKRERT